MVPSDRFYQFLDRQKSKYWGRKQLSRDTSREYDKTEGEEFRTAVAAAAYAVNSIENKKDEIQQVPRSKSRKTLSGTYYICYSLWYLTFFLKTHYID